MTEDRDTPDERDMERAGSITHSRLAMWLILSALLVVLLSVLSVSEAAGYLVLVVVVAAAGGVVITSQGRAPDHDATRDRTRCQHCGSALPSWAGLVRKTCQQCGREQSRQR